MCFFFFFKQKTAYEMRISDWSSDVCSSDLLVDAVVRQREEERDAVRQIMERAFERFALTRAFNRGGVLDPPMRAHRLAGPDRARLAGRIIADGEDEVEPGRAGLREFGPAFRARAGRIESGSLEKREGWRRELTFGGNGRAEG